MNRRQFNLGLTTMMLGLSAIPKRLNASPQLDGQKSDRTGTPSGALHSSYFFKHPTFEYVFLVSLGRAYQMAGNVGKVLYLSKQIEDGNFESAFQAFQRAADEARGIAEESASQGHKRACPLVHGDYVRGIGFRFSRRDCVCRIRLRCCGATMKESRRNTGDTDDQNGSHASSPV